MKIFFKKIFSFFIPIIIISTAYCIHALASTEKITSIKVPIIMYHSILNNPQKVGKYVITPKQFENDLIYLSNHNYHTITTTELINYVYYHQTLPTNPIILTFDDGYYNNYTYVYPLLRKYNMKGVFSIIGAEVDKYSHESIELNNNYSHLTWSQIKELSSSETVEILNHTYNMHAGKNGRYGLNRKQGENHEDYEKSIDDDILLLDKKIKYVTGKCNSTFTYPFGIAPNYATDMIKELEYKATLSCTEGMNYITNNPDCLYMLKRFNRPAGKNSSDYFKCNGID